MNNVFNFKRFGRLLFKEIWLNKLSILIMLLSLTVLSLLVAYLIPRHYLPLFLNRNPSLIFSVIALIYGMIIITNSFSELNVPEKKIEYLMLPASNLEKLLVKFFYTSVGFLLIYFAAFSFSIMIVKIYLWIFPNSDFWAPIYRPVFMQIYNMSTVVAAVLIFMSLHSVCFFGAIYFKKMELAKVFLSVVGIFVFMEIFLFILNFMPFFKEVVVNYFPLFPKIGTGENISLSFESSSRVMAYIKSSQETSFSIMLYFLPPIFWILSYIRLRETEVVDGI